MLYAYKIKAYAYLVKVVRYDLETIESSTKPAVEESYREATALYLATGELQQ